MLILLVNKTFVSNSGPWNKVTAHQQHFNKNSLENTTN